MNAASHKRHLRTSICGFASWLTLVEALLVCVAIVLLAAWGLGRFQRRSCFPVERGEIARPGLKGPSRCFATRAFPYGGDVQTVLAASFDAANLYRVRVAPLYRWAGDLARARTLLVPGQSEHPGHPHFADGALVSPSLVLLLTHCFPILCLLLFKPCSSSTERKVVETCSCARSCGRGGTNGDDDKEQRSPEISAFAHGERYFRGHA